MRKKLAIMFLTTALSSFGLIGVPVTPAAACAEPDPTIGCIGPCARPLQGSPTCPQTGGGGGKGKP